MITPMHTMRSGAGMYSFLEFSCIYAYHYFSGLGAAALNQYIYVVGGYDGMKQLNTVERYDTEHDVWEYVASMKIARSALSVTVLDCKIYAMGTKLLILYIIMLYF